MSEIIFENRLEFIESLFLDCDEINLAVSLLEIRCEYTSTIIFRIIKE